MHGSNNLCLKAVGGVPWKTFRYHLYFTYFDAKKKKTIINCVLGKELAKRENFMEKSCCLNGNSPLYRKRTTALRFQFHTSVCVLLS